jgi:hypothetical protein
VRSDVGVGKRVLDWEARISMIAKANKSANSIRCITRSDIVGQYLLNKAPR